MVSRATSLDTAIFWDIENMSSAERLSMRRLSEAVLKRGQDEGFVEGVALNRAYADWSKSEFMPLRREMVEAGVDPRQTLRFDETSKRNAADIELAVEAIDMAYQRPWISTFILVSQDGGFGAVIRKLHELGRRVVVACRGKQASRSLKTAADLFIDLALVPEGGLEDEDTNGVVVAAPRSALLPAGTMARVGLLVAPIPLPPDPANATDSIDFVQRVCHAIRDDAILGERLRTQGHVLAWVGQVFGQHARWLNWESLGFRKLASFLDRALEGTEYAVARPTGPHGDHALVLLNSIPPGYRLPGTGVGPGMSSPAVASPGIPFTGEVVEPTTSTEPMSSLAAELHLPPRLPTLLSAIQPIASPDLVDVLWRLQAVSATLHKDPECGPVIASVGLPLSTIRSAWTHLIPDQEPAAFGLTLSEILQFALQGTDLTLAAPAEDPADLRLVVRDQVPAGWAEPASAVHTEEHYRRLLRTRYPSLQRPADAESLIAAAVEMSKRSPGSQQLAALVESIAAQCAPEFSAEQIRFAVLTFARAGVFDVAQPEKVDFSDPVSLPAHRASAEAVLECLAGAARTSVIDRLGRLEERAFKPIVPWEQ